MHRLIAIVIVLIILYWLFLYWAHKKKEQYFPIVTQALNDSKISYWLEEETIKNDEPLSFCIWNDPLNLKLIENDIPNRLPGFILEEQEWGGYHLYNNFWRYPYVRVYIARTDDYKKKVLIPFHQDREYKSMKEREKILYQGTEVYVPRKN
jgi:hypothetical protein